MTSSASIVSLVSNTFWEKFTKTLLKILSMISTIGGYELIDVHCYDVLEETVYVHQRWPVSPMKKGGSCQDKHGKYQLTYELYRDS